jgi:hypothetical protein
MADTLSQALAQLNLQPGQYRRVQVNGHQIEIRCLETEDQGQLEETEMLEPWVEFPRPKPIATLRAHPGKLPLPDPPVIPADEEGNTT